MGYPQRPAEKAVQIRYYKHSPLRILGLFRYGQGALFVETLVLFVLGGAAYAWLEIAWRGVTHWSMFAAGGVCLCALQRLARRKLPLGLAAAAGAAGITLLELAVGLACRLRLRRRVWDYSGEWGNFAGLICPKYSFYWFLLCGWVIFLLRSPFYVAKKQRQNR